jgi:putative transposase
MKQRKPNRLRRYDYLKDNLYFVISCVQDKICCFGEVIAGTGRDLSVNVDGNGRPCRELSDDYDTRTGHGQSLPKIKSLSEIMGSCKTTVSKQIHLAGNREFAWQRSFHDHIIRDQKSVEKISN